MHKSKSGLIYYCSYDLFKGATGARLETSGAEAFSELFNIFANNVSIIDRSNTFANPLNTALLSISILPELNNSHSFETLCDNRARALMDQAIANNKKIAVMYSGGIDSTLILCAFLKNCNSEEVKRVTVLLSEQSILENQNFYHSYVISNFDCVSSFRFPAFIGNTDYIFISGEHGDQLFGSAIAQAYEVAYGFDALFQPLNNSHGALADFLSNRGAKKYAEPILQLFLKLCDNAPVPIETPYHFFWWINFSTKWQAVYTRLLPYSKHKKTIALEENYTTFYCTKEFQQWSMANTDQFIKDSFATAKFIAKQYIYDLNKDSSYLHKIKMGSLCNLLNNKEIVYAIDEDLNFITKPLGQEYLNPSNEFAEMEYCNVQ